MTTRLTVLIASAAMLVVAACAGPSATPTITPTTAPTTAPTIAPTTPPTAVPTVAPSVAPTKPPVAQRIEVALTDSLRIEPGQMTVTRGVPVTFVVTNIGVLDHEFYLGDAAMQAEHADEMAGMGGMGHDEENGIAVDPGETKELTYTFEAAGEWLAGCHVNGHYAAGMLATITITD